ncbi:MAG: hypothetical protein ACFB21_09760 [Opitutales bacterium]
MTVRPVWYWERARPYPVKRAWKKLPTVSTQAAEPSVLAVLTTPAMLDEAAWVAWSWSRHLSDLVSPRIIVDGKVPSAFVRQVSRILPQVECISMSEVLAGHLSAFDCLRYFCHAHPLGRKLAMILSLQEVADVLYCDSDVLAFQEPQELVGCMHAGHACYNQEDGVASYDPDMLAAGQQEGLTPELRLNSGLLFLPKQSIDLQQANRLLSHWEPRSLNWFSEQTAMALLMNSAGAIGLTSENYVVSNARQFYWQPDIDYTRVQSRHFTGTTRHLMYLKGLPYLLRATQAPRTLPLRKGQALNAAKAAVS